MKWIVKLYDGVWIAPWSGDPGRTTKKENAKRFGAIHGARVSLGLARRYRPFKNAEIERVLDYSQNVKDEPQGISSFGESDTVMPCRFDPLVIKPAGCAVKKGEV